MRSADFASTYKEYASAHRASRASPLDLFEQPAKQPFQQPSGLTNRRAIHHRDAEYAEVRDPILLRLHLPVFHDLNALNVLNGWTRGFLAARSLAQRRHHFLRKQVEGHFAGFTGYTRNREPADEMPHI